MRICDTSTACTKPATHRRLLDHYESTRNTEAACDEHKDDRLGWVKLHQEKEPDKKPKA